MNDQCWCGYLQSEHTIEARQWAYDNDQPSPCLYFMLWPTEPENCITPPLDLGHPRYGR